MSRIPKVILLIESSRAAGRDLLRGVANYVQHHGPWSVYWEAGGFEKAWPKLRTIQADGIILRDVEKVEEALASGLPAVVVGHWKSEIEGMINVVTDSETIGRMGAEHLLQCGFKHFAFCGYSKILAERTAWSEIRRDFFRNRILEAGYETPAFYNLSVTSNEWETERGLMARWLESLPKPVGLMACNDDCGQRVMDACKLAGFSVPDEVGVIGVDNDEVLCGLTDPPLSSIAVNFERGGYDAACALNGLIHGVKDVPSRITIVPSHVVPRRSTDFVAVEEPNLARALQFIRDQARNNVSVSEVSRAAGLSRRVLEKRFSRILRRSILQEIRRVRTEQIARMLVETELSVSQIADVLSFSDAQHIARYFRSNKQMSPRSYRSSYGRRGGRGSRSQNGDTYPQNGVVTKNAKEI